MPKDLPEKRSKGYTSNEQHIHQKQRCRECPVDVSCLQEYQVSKECLE